MKNPLLSAAVIVLAFWWGVITFTQGAIDDIEAADLLYAGSYIVFGGLIGALTVAVVGYLNRSALETRLSGKSLRGLTVSMGMLPALKSEPKRASTLPDPRHLAIPEIADPGFLDAWRARWSRSHAAHVALVDAVLKVMQAQPDAPATHLRDGHGGRSLIQHALLTGYLMEQVAPSWTWQGNRSRGRNRQVLIPLRNPGYQFNSNDPLLMVAAIAHDLGKLECYIYDKSGAVIGSKHEHDIVSSQMLGRLPELWAIPDADRDVLLLSVGHYHHPPDMPMESDKKPLDDRLMALTELLIYTDKVASKLEQGAPLAEAQKDEDDADEAPTGAKQETLLTVFGDVVSETDRINGDDTNYRVGQKVCVGGQPYVYFHERTLLREIAERAGLDCMAKLGNGEFRLTRELLMALDEKGVLYKVHNGKEYGAVSALWKVEFRKKNGDYLADWPAAIIVRLTDTFLPAILAMEDADVIPLIKGPVHGEQRAKKGNAGAAITDFGEMSDEEIEAKAKLQPGTPKPEKGPPPPKPAAAPAPPEDTPDWAKDDVAANAPAAPVQEPAATDAASESAEAAAPEAAVGESPLEGAATRDAPEAPAGAPADTSVISVGPIDQAAIADVATAQAIRICKDIRDGKLPKAVRHPDEEGIYIIRAAHLRSLLGPHVSWDEAVPAVEAGMVPGVRHLVEDVGGQPVALFLFNVDAVLAQRASTTAFSTTGDLPVRSKEPVPGDPF